MSVSKLLLEGVVFEGRLLLPSSLGSQNGLSRPSNRDVRQRLSSNGVERHGPRRPHSGLYGRHFGWS